MEVVTLLVHAPGQFLGPLLVAAVYDLPQQIQRTGLHGPQFFVGEHSLLAHSRLLSLRHETGRDTRASASDRQAHLFSFTVTVPFSE